MCMCVCLYYLRLSEPVTVPVVVVVVDMAVVVVVDVVVVVEPVFIVGMTAADSFSFSFSLSALSSDQYLFTHNHFIKKLTFKPDGFHFNCFYQKINNVCWQPFWGLGTVAFLMHISMHFLGCRLILLQND